MQGGIKLKQCNADMPSYTFAIKAQKLLKARGYFCEIKRNQNISNSGCGYYLIINESCERAEEILKKYSVPFERIRNEVDRT